MEEVSDLAKWGTTRFGFPDVLRETNRLFWKNVKVIAAIVLLIYFIAGIFAALVSQLKGLERLGQSIIYLSPLFAFSSIALIVEHSIHGYKTGFSTAFSHGLKRFPKMAAFTILAIIAVGVGLYFANIPGLIIAAYLGFFPAIIALRPDIGFGDVWGYSKKLVVGQRLRIFGYLCLCIVISYGFDLLLVYIPYWIYNQGIVPLVPGVVPGIVSYGFTIMLSVIPLVNLVFQQGVLVMLTVLFLNEDYQKNGIPTDKVISVEKIPIPRPVGARKPSPLGDIILGGLLSGLASSATVFMVTFFGGIVIVFSPFAPGSTAETMGWATGLFCCAAIPALFGFNLLISIPITLIVKARNASTNLHRISIITGIAVGAIASIGYLIYMGVNIINRTPGF